MDKREEILLKLKNYYNQNKDLYKIEEIGIFGSWAKGKATKNSDVDVYIKLKDSNLFKLSRIRIELEELLGIKTDLVQLREKMNKYLKNHIKNEAISA